MGVILKTYLVWDEFNSSRDSCKEILEMNECSAAISYAEQDISGLEDGLYTKEHREIHNLTKEGNFIMVENPEGVTKRFRVGVVSFLPIWDALEIKL